jgi:hypothetical protein
VRSEFVNKRNVASEQEIDASSYSADEASCVRERVKVVVVALGGRTKSGVDNRKGGGRRAAAADGQQTVRQRISEKDSSGEP